MIIKTVCLTAILSALATTSGAQDTGVSGTWVGTTQCDDGERMIVLSLVDDGQLTEADMEAFDFLDPCRSGSGPCNDQYRTMFLASHKYSGEVSFYPTSANPSASRTSIAVIGRLSSLSFNGKVQRPDLWNRDTNPVYAEEIVGLYVQSADNDVMQAVPLGGTCFQSVLFQISSE